MGEGEVPQQTDGSSFMVAFVPAIVLAIAYYIWNNSKKTERLVH